MGILNGLLRGAKGVGNFALFGADTISSENKKLDKYDPKHPVFNMDEGEASALKKKVKKTQDNVKLASAIHLVMNGVDNKKTGFISLTKTAGSFGHDLRKNIAWGTALAAASGLVGFGLNALASSIDKGLTETRRRKAYKDYLVEAKIKDTPAEKRLFNAAYHMNPHLMSNPTLAASAVRQVKDYGGFDINLAGNLGKVAPPRNMGNPMENNISTYGRLLASRPNSTGDNDILLSTHKKKDVKIF